MTATKPIENDSVFSEETFALKPLSSLQTWERNYRQGDVSAIAASIARFGFNGALRVWKGNVVMAGNHALLALRQLKESGEPAPYHVAEANGEWFVKTIDLSHLNRREAEAFALADNRTASLGSNDDEALAHLLKELQEHDPELVKAAAFDDESLNALLSTISEPIQEDESQAAQLVDRAAELQEKWSTCVGQVWSLGEHILVIGDCLVSDVTAKLLQGIKPAIVYADPPYGMDLDTDWSGAKSSLQMLEEKGLKGGTKYARVEGDDKDYDPQPLLDAYQCEEVFLWGADYYAERLPNKNEGSWFVWDKRLDESADKMYGSCFETCWSKAKHKRDIIRIKWAGVFGTEQEPDRRRYHPNQKPVALAEWFIERYTKSGDVVIDPYTGSGSCLIACERQSRICRAAEIIPAYAAVTLERWSSLIGCEPKLIQ